MIDRLDLLAAELEAAGRYEDAKAVRLAARALLAITPAGGAS